MRLLLLSLGMAFLGVLPHPSPATEQNPLVGSWRMVSYQAHP